MFVNGTMDPGNHDVLNPGFRALTSDDFEVALSRLALRTNSVLHPWK